MMKNSKQENVELCFQECKGILKTLAIKYKSIYDNDVEEAFAEASMWLVELYDSFDKNRASFVTYAYSVIENKFINAGKKFYRERCTMIDATIEELDQEGLLTDSNEIILDTEMTLGQKKRCDVYFELVDYLDRVSEREEKIFKLYYYDSWSISELAEYFELSEIRIKEIKNNCVRKLREIQEND